MFETWRSKPLSFARYCELTALLFELATGKVDADVEEACRARRRARGSVTSRTFEMFEMLLECDGVPNVFEDSD